MLSELSDRFGKFGLRLHEEKTRLIEFGRYAAERRAKRGEQRPETFDFLWFTHCSSRTNILKMGLISLYFSGSSFMWSGTIMDSTMISLKDSALIPNSNSSLKSFI